MSVFSHSFVCDTIMNFTAEERLLLQSILIFYRHHHMSSRNPQQKDIDRLLDKISKGDFNVSD